ncbi:WxcM-like domain-containing protein [Dysgonomonas sp. 520]|nr:WxcM-like domain-containing protein [Dysgonomonas sp. 520]
MKKNTVFDCSFIRLPVIENKAGNITPVLNNVDIPFEMRRVFYIYDIPAGETRGVHAHKYCHEILVAATGSFEVELDDGKNIRTVTLNHPMYALHIPPGIWATEKNYSSATVCLALTSDVYEEEDYIRTYAEFKKFRSE